MRYRLYLDEVGHDDFAHAHDDRYRYLSLSGVIMEHDYTRDIATPNLNAFKADIFKHDPEETVILHRKDIMQKKGPFGLLDDEGTNTRFDVGLLTYLNDTKFSLISAVIDKLEMTKKQQWEQRHPYHYLMEIMVEKYTRWLIRHDATFDIMPEKRHGKKDEDLQRAYASVRIWGTSWARPKTIRERLPASKLKFRAKRDNVTGLQICDLVAYPSHAYVRQQQGHTVALGPFSQKVVPLLRNSKYDRSSWGRILGYGIK